MERANTPPLSKSATYARYWLQAVFFILAGVELANGLMALFFQDAAASFYSWEIRDPAMTQQYGLALCVVAAAYFLIGLDPVANRRLLLLPVVEVALATFWTFFLSRGQYGSRGAVLMAIGYCLFIVAAVVAPTAMLRTAAEGDAAPPPSA
ncbi:MAG: hypothetical protein SNJ67_06940 [Chloracidobacterium sp.]|uniref:Uncharacterized protein n=1 Tax=Chloracidobacterium validum TaxID=2821543 RepID=A0ABX8BFR9_9BACT|nr:hypothetical protein [Chloracidobacterium validum]QUW04468.1 hypothetical protein J8C06_11785 [Chloracidobacterium validum]